MATSGTVTGLLFGFGTFLVTKISHDYTFLYYTIFSLVFAILANLGSFVFCMMAFRIKDYYFIMREGFRRQENTLTKEDILSISNNINNSEHLDRSKIEEFEKLGASEFYSKLIRYYLIANAYNKKNNDLKAKSTYYAQIMFLIGLITVPILLGFLIYAYYINKIILSSV
jgi:O-antigen/teichoic acid export membrane protein